MSASANPLLAQITNGRKRFEAIRPKLLYGSNQRATLAIPEKALTSVKNSKT